LIEEVVSIEPSQGDIALAIAREEVEPDENGNTISTCVVDTISILAVNVAATQDLAAMFTKMQSTIESLLTRVNNLEMELCNIKKDSLN